MVTKVIKKGDKISVDYTGTLDDGTMFDSSKHGDHSHPLEFEVGSGQIIKGFDDAVLGMSVGQEKDIHLLPKDAYGDPTPQLMQKIPKQHLPPGFEPKKGLMLVLSAPDGQQIPAKIIEISEKDITMDLNHPLAGKNLNFKIKIAAIN